MNAPPAISPDKTGGRELSAVWGFGGMSLLLALARLSLVWPLPLPFCLWKALTGVPCPFCGGVRCFQAAARLDFAAAFHWNPLAFAACVGITVWFIAWTAERLWHRRWLEALRPLFRVRAVKLGIIGAILLNWIYLWFRIP